MRIISKFTDYYDCIMRTGMDKTIVYNRKEETFSIKNSSLEDLSLSTQTYNKFEEHKFLIGFCGKIYPVVCIAWTESCFPYLIGNTQFSIRGISKYFYSQQDYLDFFNSSSKEFQKKLQDNVGNIGRLWLRWESIYDHDWSSLCKYFVEYKTPIFIIKRNDAPDKHCEEITINFSLGNFEFYKIKDTYSAFQDISMYISGVLGVGQPELIQIGNKEMIQKKGFDKWSFRKMSEKVK